MRSRFYSTYILLLLIPCSFLKAQERNPIDSLLSTIPASHIDSQRVRDVIHLANQFYLNNPILAKNLTDIALKDANDVGYKLGIADSYNLYGIISLNSGKYDSALEEFSKAQKIYFDLKNPQGIVNTYNNIGLTYSDLGQYSDAILNYTQALKVIDSFQYERLSALIYTNLAKLYIELNIYDEAEKFLSRGLAIITKHNLNQNLEYIYCMLGDIALRKESIVKAREYYDMCKKECIKSNNRLVLSVCKRNIGSIFEFKGDYNQAEQYYKNSLSIAVESNDISSKVRVLNSLSYLYYRTNLFKIAREYAIEAFQISQEIGFKEGLRNSSINLGYINYSLGNFKQAYDHLIYSDTILSEISDNKIVFTVSELLTKIEKVRSDSLTQINLQRKQIRILILITIILFLVSLIITIILIYRRRINNSLTKEHHLNREITSKVMSLAKRNEVLSKIETMLIQNKYRFIPENQPLIQEVINEIQSAQDQHLWKEFEYYFNSVHKNFYSKLNAQYPNLTINERRLCALISLNLTTKNISSITHQSMHSIDIARARLRKKLGISNVKVSVYSFLSNF